MPKFQFRLQTLLNLRAADRQQRRAMLAESLADERSLDAERATLAHQLVELELCSRQGVAPGRIDLAALTRSGNFADKLRLELTKITLRRQGLAQEIAERQQALAAADREVKVLEKLRDRQLDVFRQQQSRAETRDLDEAALRRARIAQGTAL